MKYFDKMMVFERPVVIHVDEDIVYGIAFNEKEIEKMAKGTFQTKENILQEYIEYVVGVGSFLSLPDHEENISDDGCWWYIDGGMHSMKSTNVEDYCHRAYAENPLRYLVVDLFSYKKEQLDGNAVISKELWKKVKKNNNLFVPMRTYRHWNWQKQRKRKQRKQRRLFATLDTTVRKVIVDNLPFLLSDTVGFIRKLPTDLVDSFKSTLDEVREADLLLHIVDISHPDFEDQIKVVDKTLADLGCSEKPQMIVFNKIDAYTWEEKDADDLTPATSRNVSLDELIHSWISRLGGQCLFISAQERTNIDTLKQVLYNKVRELYVQKYPYNDFLFEKYEGDQD